MLSRWPTGRRIAFTTRALPRAGAHHRGAACRASRSSGWLRALEVLAIVVDRRPRSPALVIGLIVSRMANYQDPEDEAEFERLVVRSERLARENLAAEPDEGEFMELDPYNPDDFETLVQRGARRPPGPADQGAGPRPGRDLRQGPQGAAPTGSTRATRSRATTTTTGSSSSATRCCATSGTTRTCCATRSRARCATSWRTTSARTSSASARWAFSTMGVEHALRRA